MSSQPPARLCLLQAEDRLHRKGQHAPVMLHYLVAHDAGGAQAATGRSSRGCSSKEERKLQGEREGEASEVDGATGRAAQGVPTASRLSEFDRRRFGAFCRMIRALGDVTDGPALSQAMLVEHEPGAQPPDSLSPRPTAAAHDHSASALLSTSDTQVAPVGARGSGADIELSEGCGGGGREQAVAGSPGGLWFQVSRYSGCLHLVCERDPDHFQLDQRPEDASLDCYASAQHCAGAGQHRFGAVGVTLDTQVLEAPSLAHPAVVDWLRSLPHLPATDQNGGGKHGLTGEEVWAAARQVYRAYCSLSATQKRVLQSGASCCRAVAGPARGGDAGGDSSDSSQAEPIVLEFRQLSNGQKVRHGAF